MKKICFILTAVFLLGCTNPFSTRTPEKPASNQQPQAVNSLQTNPDSLLAKMQYAFRDKNVNYYLECLADADIVQTRFVFVPQQNESYRLNAWSRQDEYNYFNRLTNNNAIQTIILQIFNVRDWTLIGAGQDTMQTRFDYEIELNFKTRREYYRGQSIFKIVRSAQSLWYVSY